MTIKELHQQTREYLIDDSYDSEFIKLYKKGYGWEIKGYTDNDISELNNKVYDFIMDKVNNDTAFRIVNLEVRTSHNVYEIRLDYIENDNNPKYVEAAKRFHEWMSEIEEKLNEKPDVENSLIEVEYDYSNS